MQIVGKSRTNNELMLLVPPTKTDAKNHQKCNSINLMGGQAINWMANIDKGWIENFFQVTKHVDTFLELNESREKKWKGFFFWPKWPHKTNQRLNWPNVLLHYCWTSSNQCNYNANLPTIILVLWFSQDTHYRLGAYELAKKK